MFQPELKVGNNRMKHDWLVGNITFYNFFREGWYNFLEYLHGTIKAIKFHVTILTTTSEIKQCFFNSDVNQVLLK